MKYIISLLLIIISYNAIGQESDSLEADYRPTGIRFGVDAMALGYTFFNDHINSQLFVADIDFHKYFLVLEYGQYERTRIGDANTYNTDGSYWRIGADMNFFKKNPKENVLSLGIRYGNSTFSDELTTVYNDAVYGNYEITRNNDKINADWFELVAGIKVPVWKLWLGYNMRMKFGIDKFEGNEFRPYEIPGYGIGSERTYWEFNYFIMYRIAWGDKKELPDNK